MKASELRARAAHYRKIADAISDELTASRLREMADEYDGKADQELAERDPIAEE